jgi:hypothetical protein
MSTPTTEPREEDDREESNLEWTARSYSEVLSATSEDMNDVLSFFLDTGTGMTLGEYAKVTEIPEAVLQSLNEAVEGFCRANREIRQREAQNNAPDSQDAKGEGN